MNEADRIALVQQHAPPSVFPGPADKTAGMLAALCPEDQLATTPPDLLRQKLALVRFEHKASTPSDDDEYWLAQSPFDQKFYVFASCAFGGGWPRSPAYVLDDRPTWFDED